MKQLDKVRDQLKDLIINTCNKIGCDNCPYKWDRDEDGNACRSDFLMMEEAELMWGDK